MSHLEPLIPHSQASQPLAGADFRNALSLDAGYPNRGVDYISRSSAHNSGVQKFLEVLKAEITGYFSLVS
jgi:hypothetical protein